MAVEHNQEGASQEQTPHQSYTIPNALEVVCNGVVGLFHPSTHRLKCMCRDCRRKEGDDEEGEVPLMTPNEFERHSGMAASKKWKYTIRVPQVDGGEPELLGDWLEARGLDITVHGRARRMQPAPPLSSDRGPGILSVPASHKRREEERRGKGAGEAGDAPRTGDQGDGEGTKVVGEHASPPAAGKASPSSKDNTNNNGSGLPRWHAATGPFQSVPLSRPLTPQGSQVLDAGSGSILEAAAAAARMLMSRHPHLATASYSLPLATQPDRPTLSRDPRVLAQYTTAAPSVKQQTGPSQKRSPSSGGSSGERSGKRQRRLPQRLSEAVDPGEALGLLPALPNTKLGLGAALAQVTATTPSTAPVPLQSVNNNATRSGLASGSVRTTPPTSNCATMIGQRSSTPAHHPELVQALKTVLQQRPGALSTLASALGLAGTIPNLQRPVSEPALPPQSQHQLGLANVLLQPPAAASARPHVVSWSLLGPDLHLTVRFGGRDYNGTLHGPSPGPQPFVRAPTRPRSVPQWAQAPTAVEGSLSSGRSPSTRVAAAATTPNRVPATSAQPTHPSEAAPPGSDDAPKQDGEETVQPEPLGPRGEDPAEIERYWSKARAGPEPEALCALCHQADAPSIPRKALGPGGRARGALGALVLVQPTRKTYAWAHEQCLRWSPEVAESNVSDIRDLAGKAVLRGRGLRCKMCGAKGATLGCMTHCSTSLHLPCALRTSCLLMVSPYRVACTKHADRMSLDPDSEVEGDAETETASEEGRYPQSSTAAAPEHSTESGRPASSSPKRSSSSRRDTKPAPSPSKHSRRKHASETKHHNLSALDTLSLVALEH